MQQTPTVGELKERATALNLTLRAVAKRAGLAPSTAWRAENGKGETRKKTDRALAATIEAEELKMLEHLQQLYPQAFAQPDKRDAA